MQKENRTNINIMNWGIPKRDLKHINKVTLPGSQIMGKVLRKKCKLAR